MHFYTSDIKTFRTSISFENKSVSMETPNAMISIPSKGSLLQLFTTIQTVTILEKSHVVLGHTKWEKHICYTLLRLLLVNILQLNPIH